MCPELFYKPHKVKTSEMRLNFTANSFVFGRINREIAPKIFCKACTEKTFEVRLNFTTNSFVFGRKNGDNVPRTFYINLARCKLPKCV